MKSTVNVLSKNHSRHGESSCHLSHRLKACGTKHFGGVKVHVSSMPTYRETTKTVILGFSDGTQDQLAV